MPSEISTAHERASAINPMMPWRGPQGVRSAWTGHGSDMMKRMAALWLYAGNIPVWSAVDDAQSNSWSAVVDTQSASWVAVTDTQSSTWTPIED